MGAGIKRTSSGGKGRRAMSEINITPMVDVMLVLLVIFMVTAPLLTSGIPLNLPKASGKSFTSDEHTLNVSVDADGKYYIGESEVDEAAIIPKLMAMTKNNQDLDVVISGDKDASYGRVIVLMAKLKSAGFTKVGLKTEAPKQ